MHDLVWDMSRMGLAVDGTTRLLKVFCLGGLPTCVAGVRSLDEAELWIGWHRGNPYAPATLLAAQYGYIFYPLS